MASLVAAIIGLGTARPGMAVIGIPMAIYFAGIAWLISRPRKPAPWDFPTRLFSRLGIKWLVDPEWRDPKHGPGDV
jgi:hypothetical protein